ncbi:LysR substrate-binding domain-containing protein [Vibrio mexicanus]|uniref:LysR substrate-binding domain-containing protein n=1 Tax=Vibrio mexicanus TaxID=1004326 RepID=UPI00069C011D|nr:LysR substrate-binding domain-containing protein [Vibrio mexicanus]
MLPPLKSLVAFEACARNQSISKAAQELHVTQAAVSQHIKTLEQFLGFALFNREHRRLTLSTAGQKYYPTVHQSLFAIRNQTQAMTHNNQAQQLTIKVNTSFAYFWLVPMLEDFYRKHPYINVRLHTDDWPQLEDNHSEADIEIVNGQGNENQYGELICKEYWVAVCSPSFYEAHCDQILSGAFDQLPGIYVRGYAEGWPEWLATHAFSCPSPNRQYEVGSTMMGLELAAKGAGVMLCRSLNAVPLLTNGEVIALSDKVMSAADCHYLSYNRHQAPPKVTLFTLWFKQQLLKKRPEDLFFKALEASQHHQINSRVSTS